MKVIRDKYIHELTYEYDNELAMNAHKKFMLAQGFSVVTDHVYKYFNPPLSLTYQKSKLENRNCESRL